MARQRFMAEMEASLKEFDEQMTKLVLRPKPKGEQARLELEKTYFMLKAKREALRERIEQARHLPEDAWDKFQASVTRIHAELAQALQALQSGA